MAESSPCRAPGSDPASPQPNNLVVCPRCSCNVREVKLAAHIRKVHPARPASTRMSFVAARGTALKQAGRLISCPHCRVGVLAEALAEHRREVHPTKQHAVSLETRERTSSNSTTIARRLGERLGNDGPRDATRGTGFAVRERGRFGSHPVHDDYSDESDSS